jgi:predicted metal-dependent RNase
MAPEKAAEKIKQVVPEDAGITDIKFDTNFGEALIESAKPGLVIGKNGRTLSEIKLAVGWTPAGPENLGVGNGRHIHING